MPNFFLTAEKVDLEDSEQIGKTFAKFSLLRNIPGISVPNIIFLNKNCFNVFFKPYWSNFVQLFQKESISESLIQNTKKLLETKFVLPQSLNKELLQKTKKWKKPFLVKGILLLPDSREEFSVFEDTIIDQNKLLESIKQTYFSILKKELLEKIAKSNHLDDFSIVVSIAQKIIPEISGEIETNLKEKNTFLIKAQWGEFDPRIDYDLVLINKIDLVVENYKVVSQTEQTAFVGGSFKKFPISTKFQKERKLSDENLKTIAKAFKSLHSKTLTYTKLFFSIEEGKIFATDLQVNIDSETSNESLQSLIFSLPLLSSLKPIFPSIASGVIKLVRNEKDFKTLRHSQIAVINSLKKEYLPFLKKAKGVVINTSQDLTAAQKSWLRNLGVSAVTGKLNRQDGSVITLDGRDGKVYQGSFNTPKSKILQTKKLQIFPSEIKTVTKIFANLPYSETNLNVNLTEADGIGPLQLENLNLKTRDQAKDFLIKICEQSEGKSVIINLSNNHPNPDEFLGFQAELVREIRNKSIFKNISLSLPASITVNNFIKIRKIITAQRLHRSPTLKIYSQIDKGANIFNLEEFLAIGIDGVVIDYWSLVNNLYNSDFSYLELTSFSDKAIENSLRQILQITNKAKVFSLLYNFPIENEILKTALSLSIKSLSTSWQSVQTLRKNVSETEKDLLKLRH